MIRKIFAQHKRLIAYFFIGISAVIVDVGFFYYFHEKLLLRASLANVISMAISTTYGFCMNAFLNFKTSDKILKRFFSYSLISILAMLAGSAILFVFSDNMGFNGTLVKVLSVPAIAFLQYLFNTKFSFSTKFALPTKRIAINRRVYNT